MAGFLSFVLVFVSCDF